MFWTLVMPHSSGAYYVTVKRRDRQYNPLHNWDGVQEECGMSEILESKKAATMLLAPGLVFALR